MPVDDEDPSTGTRGRPSAPVWTGLGHDHDGSKFTNSPAKLASSFVHSSLKARMYSSPTDPRSS